MDTGDTRLCLRDVPSQGLAGSRTTDPASPRAHGLASWAWTELQPSHPSEEHRVQWATHTAIQGGPGGAGSVGGAMVLTLVSETELVRPKGRRSALQGVRTHREAG